MPIWPLDRKGKNPAQSTRDLSPNGKALATISANLAHVISPESSDGTERSVPDLVSHLVSRYRQLQDLYRDLKRENDVLKNENTTLERTIQASQERTQTQRDGWVDNLAPSARDLSPNGKALAAINASLAYVIPPEDSEGRERNVPQLVSHLVARYRQLQDLCRNLKRESDLLKHEKTTLERTIQKNQETAQTQRDEWNNREARYRSEIDRLKDAVNRLRQSSEEANREISKQREDLDNALQASHHAQEQLHQSHRTNVEDIQNKNATREAGLRAKYEISERRMKEDHDSAVRHLRCVVESLEKDLEKRKKEFELETMQLKESHKVKQDKLKDDFKTYEFQLKQTHKQQQERLQKDIQSRNKALIARENYSPTTDGELKTFFSSLVREVDSLARLKWTMNQSPWPDEELSRISDTPKRLQKQIMKETIWDILYEQVFCSPFRVFGTEGSVLESEWNKAFGGDPKAEDEYYTWPKPSFDAERWRYETMRQAAEGLKVETSEYDPRTKLRKGFQSSTETIFERLSGVLKMVSEVDQETKKTMKEIANNAAKMCVAFGTQRCRIFVVMKGLKTVEEFKEDSKREGKFVDLLTQPELRRIGDAEGQSLDKEFTVVAGCEGEIKRFCY